jgi:putative oxygen-independent coproporphyrinogen III oxidase
MPGPKKIDFSLPMAGSSNKNKIITTIGVPGLYIHVPFCRGKCPYCDFASGTNLAGIPDWLAALDREMGMYRDFAPRFDTLYLGGGTPSLLTPPQLAGLLKSLEEHFQFAPDTEITLEANPDDLTLQVLNDYRKLGINRLSLGVQSFYDRELDFLGRRHNAAQALQALSFCRTAGFDHLGIDLMYGLPGQTLEAWQESLDTALSFRPEHLSCYQLTVEEGTPLAHRQAEGEFQALPEETARTFFLFTSKFLEDRGYLHYEISNFAWGPAHKSRHNCKYWNHTPYLGLGPAAHSYKDGRRWWNHSSLEDYCQALAAGQAPIAGQEVLTEAEKHREALYLGLRTKDGVHLDLVRNGASREDALREALQAGLAEVWADRVVLTREGMVLADRLAVRFME